jgi:hypothetical protein
MSVHQSGLLHIYLEFIDFAIVLFEERSQRVSLTAYHVAQLPVVLPTVVAVCQQCSA